MVLPELQRVNFLDEFVFQCVGGVEAATSLHQVCPTWRHCSDGALGLLWSGKTKVFLTDGVSQPGHRWVSCQLGDQLLKVALVL